MIAHNGDCKRIAPIILDIHMSIVSSNGLTIPVPCSEISKLRACRYAQNYTFIVCLYMYFCWISSYQEGNVGVH